MSFGERMKGMLGQGAQISKGVLSKAGEKAQDWGGKGLEASKDFLSKAGAKAQDMGERGVLLLEIKQFEGQTQKLLTQLGGEVYRLLVEEGLPTVTAEEPGVNTLLAELAVVKENIEKREAELDARRGTTVQT